MVYTGANVSTAYDVIFIAGRRSSSLCGIVYTAVTTHKITLIFVFIF